MNGRLYDPVIARFFSPDTYVQHPGFTQAYNRYSYALNNPLRYVDRTGEWYDEYDDDNYTPPHEIDPVECNGSRPDHDPFGNFRGIDEGIFDELLPDDCGGDPRNPQVKKNFNDLLMKTGNYKMPVALKNGTSNFSGNGNSNELPDNYNALFVPLSDEFIETAGLGGTVWGGAATMTAVEMKLAGEFAKAIKVMKIGGTIVGAVGTGLTGVNVGYKVYNGTVNTADFVDLGASVGLLITGLALANPVGIGIVVLGGVVYGIYRLSAGEEADIWINNKFGFRP